jgi:hypothetical protein
MDAVADAEAPRDRNRTDPSAAAWRTVYERIECQRQPPITDQVEGIGSAVVVSLDPSKRAGSLFECGLARRFLGVPLGVPLVPHPVVARSCPTPSTPAPADARNGIQSASCNGVQRDRHACFRDGIARASCDGGCSGGLLLWTRAPM